MPRSGGAALAPFEYDPETALLLAVASTWAYAEAPTLRDVLERSLLPELEVTLLEVSNPARLIDTQAFVVRQPAENVTVVAFRGTEIGGANAIDLLTDLAVDPIRYPRGETTRVHRGFLDSLVAVWPRLVEALDENPDDEILLTGHSLGGALASLMAAMLCIPNAGGVMEAADEARRVAIRDRVVATHTYGQPMVGTPEFVALATEAMDGVMPPVVRHVFDDDVIPRQPGGRVGPFAHLGIEMRANEDSTEWIRSVVSTPQDRGVLGSLGLGTIDFLFRQFAGLRRFELPRSLSDHLPQHYVDVCKRQVFAAKGKPVPYYP